MKDQWDMTEYSTALSHCMYCIVENTLSVTSAVCIYIYVCYLKLFDASEHHQTLAVTALASRRHWGLVQNWATVLSRSRSWNCATVRDGNEQQYAERRKSFLNWEQPSHMLLFTTSHHSTASSPYLALGAGSMGVIQRSGIWLVSF